MTLICLMGHLNNQQVEDHCVLSRQDFVNNYR